MSNQSLLPVVAQSPIFTDYFRYRGHANLPGSATLPDHWDVLSGDFTTFSEKMLEVKQVGEMRYVGTSLNELRSISGNANYMFQIFLVGQQDLIFEIRGRNNTTDFISLEVDFQNGYLRLKNGNTIVSELEYALYVGRYYQIDLAMLDNVVYSVVNGFVSQVEDMSTNITVHDFSLVVTSLSDLSHAEFKGLRIFELTPNPTMPTNADPSDLIILHRELMIHHANHPDEFTWESYKSLDQHFQLHKNLGRTNSTWALYGYGVNHPSTEQWFNDV